MSTRQFFSTLDAMRVLDQQIDAYHPALSMMCCDEKARLLNTLLPMAAEIRARIDAWEKRDDQDDEARVRREIRQPGWNLKEWHSRDRELQGLLLLARELRDATIRLHECRRPELRDRFPVLLDAVVTAARDYNATLARLQLHAATKLPHKKRGKSLQDASGTTEPSGVPLPGGVT